MGPQRHSREDIDIDNQRELIRLGNTVRRLRKDKGMSRRALSEVSHVSERHLAQLETGKGNISVMLLSRIAPALGTDLAALFGHDPNQADMETEFISDLVRQINPGDRQRVAQMLIDQFVKVNDEKRKLALIGLRGAGKSTLGELLAEKYQLPFVRLVREVEQLAGMNVSEIFSLSGQDYYRRLEHKALMNTLNQYDECIIETGGSIVTDLNILSLLLKSCYVVWLNATPEDHMQRVIEQGDLRPIQNNADAMSDLRKIMQQREALYKQAHIELFTSGKTVNECLESLSEIFPLNTKNSQSISGERHE
ncbi:MAG: helix-turn-helix transcriptional regulator [Gammaproteobacteria bacterium]|nr:helix-turn-helix transcriptional regulator [Gammaproteobacteria bacterium]